jgi:hypothetical protein
MRVDVDTLKGQLSGGDIHNTQSVDGKSTAQQFNAPIGGDVAGGNIIICHGEIHFHVTLASDELLAVLPDLLKLATSGNQKLSC